MKLLDSTCDFLIGAAAPAGGPQNRGAAFVPHRVGSRRGTGPRITASLLCATVFLGVACRRPAERVVLVTIDTLRADHVGCYGASEGATPTLDALARDGVRFATAISPTPLTLPSHASLFTGLDPAQHRVHHNTRFRLEEDAATLAGRMRAGGYATAGFIGALVLDREYGLARGFDHYDDRMSTRRSGGDAGFAERTANEVVDSALVWLEQAPDRFFVWIHLYDPHAGYSPPPAYRNAHPDSPYTGEVAFADAELGRLLAAIDGRWSPRGTLVVATSDHGESLGEHGEGTHAYTLYDATQRVPLLMRGLDLPRGQVVTTPVRLVDVAPTILALAGQEPLSSISGADLVPLIEGTEASPRTAYVETVATRLDLGWSALFGVRTERYKYIRAPRPELYDLEGDPDELQNIAAEAAEVVERLDRALEQRIAGRAPVRSNFRPAEQQLDLLEKLGYVTEPAETAAIVLGDVGGADPKDALDGFRRLLAVDALLSRNRTREALAALETIEGGGLRAAATRARASLEAGDAEAAERHARAAIALDPSAAYTYLLLGNSLAEQGRLDEARGAYDASLAMDPARGKPLEHLGRVAEAEDDGEGAAEFYERAISARDPDTSAIWRLAALRIEQRLFTDAHALLSRLPREVEHGVEAALRLSRAEIAAGRPRDAWHRLATARRFHRNSAEVAAAHGSVLYRLGRTAEAAAAFRRARALDPGALIDFDPGSTSARGARAPRRLARDLERPAPETPTSR